MAKKKQIATVTQTVSPITTDPRKNELTIENKKQLDKGECPARLIEEDKKVQWDCTVVKEPFNSLSDVMKHITNTKDHELAVEIISRGTFAIAPDYTFTNKFNIALQSLSDSSPKDATEAKLCMQSTALYSQGMSYLARAESSNTFQQSQHYINYAIKLLRLHNETVEAASRYRRGGEQHVIVQHVNVNDGGKAVVSGQTVTNSGGV